MGGEEAWSTHEILCAILQFSMRFELKHKTKNHQQPFCDFCFKILITVPEVASLPKNSYENHKRWKPWKHWTEWQFKRYLDLRENFANYPDFISFNRAATSTERKARGTSCFLPSHTSDPQHHFLYVSHAFSLNIILFIPPYNVNFLFLLYDTLRR